METPNGGVYYAKPRSARRAARRITFTQPAISIIVPDSRQTGAGRLILALEPGLRMVIAGEMRRVPLPVYAPTEEQLAKEEGANGDY
jgi:hypothetical protein